MKKDISKKEKQEQTKQIEKNINNKKDTYYQKY
jgi:hypothetical protein